MKKLSFYYHMTMIHVIALTMLVKIILKGGKGGKEKINSNIDKT